MAMPACFLIGIKTPGGGPIVEPQKSISRTGQPIELVKETFMSIRISTIAFLASLLPAQLAAQDAFITQISGSGASISIEMPAVQTPSTTTLISSLTASLPSVTPAALFGSIDLSAYPLVPAAVDGAVATVSSFGNNNSAEILQTGIHAASISQQANNAWAGIYQTAGTNNRASIYQASNGASAAISQQGSNNRALIVQN